MLGLDEPREQDVDDRESKEDKDAVLEHEMLIRDAWHRNAVSMAYAPRDVPYPGQAGLLGRPRSTPTILEEDSS
jgi:hypothetical protein